MSRITLHGRDHATPRHVSAWQSDRAYRYERLGKRILRTAAASPEPLSHSLAAGAAVAVAVVAGLVAMAL